VVLGAILVVGTQAEASVGDGAAVVPLNPASGRSIPLAFVEILGCSVLERMVEQFLASDAECVSLLAESRIGHLLPDFRQSYPKVNVVVADDLELAIAQTLKSYCENGIDYALVSTAGAYTECDFIDLLWFHRGSRQPITRVVNHKSDVDLWVVDCAKVLPGDLVAAISAAQDHGSASYMVSEYVNPLASLADVRQLAVDAFNGRCAVRPAGTEVRPGVWVDEKADIHKRARIVAPAYIGRSSKICEDTVITRCSTIESLCHIDFGTVVEDSSVLSRSYVGIWLDVSHSVVSGNRLFNLHRDVALEIPDGSVLGPNVMPAQKAKGEPSLVSVSSPLVLD
jgi:NDP-sugar pyrophosphorylase family protein